MLQGEETQEKEFQFEGEGVDHSIGLKRHEELSTARRDSSLADAGQKERRPQKRKEGNRATKNG